MFTELEWRLTKARVLGRREDHADAERLAHEAVAIGESTDYVQGQGDAYVCLGDVLVLSAESREAVAAFEHALERYERKGSVVSAEQIRSRLAELRAAAVQ